MDVVAADLAAAGFGRKALDRLLGVHLVVERGGSSEILCLGGEMDLGLDGVAVADRFENPDLRVGRDRFRAELGNELLLVEKRALHLSLQLLGQFAKTGSENTVGGGDFLLGDRAAGKMDRIGGAA